MACSRGMADLSAPGEQHLPPDGLRLLQGTILGRNPWAQVGLRLRLGPLSQQDGFYSRARGGRCALEPDRWYGEPAVAFSELVEQFRAPVCSERQSSGIWQHRPRCQHSVPSGLEKVVKVNQILIHIYGEGGTLAGRGWLFP